MCLPIGHLGRGPPGALVIWEASCSSRRRPRLSLHRSDEPPVVRAHAHPRWRSQRRPRRRAARAARWRATSSCGARWPLSTRAPPLTRGQRAWQRRVRQVPVGDLPGDRPSVGASAGRHRSRWMTRGLGRTARRWWPTPALGLRPPRLDRPRPRAPRPPAPTPPARGAPVPARSRPPTRRAHPASHSESASSSSRAGQGSRGPLAEPRETCRRASARDVANVIGQRGVPGEITSIGAEIVERPGAVRPTERILGELAPCRYYPRAVRCRGRA
jgi:hypothetical protein